MGSISTKTKKKEKTKENVQQRWNIAKEMSNLDRCKKDDKKQEEWKNFVYG